MARNRRSAKSAGTRFESDIVSYLSEWVDDRIERRRLSGANDRGDISSLRHLGQRIVAECKNVTKISLGTWAAEAERQRINDNAGVGLIFHKRHGKGHPKDQWVTMTVEDFVSLINGNNNHREQE